MDSFSRHIIIVVIKNALGPHSSQHFLRLKVVFMLTSESSAAAFRSNCLMTRNQVHVCFNELTWI